MLSPDDFHLQAVKDIEAARALPARQRAETLDAIYTNIDDTAKSRQEARKTFGNSIADGLVVLGVTLGTVLVLGFCGMVGGVAGFAMGGILMSAGVVSLAVDARKNDPDYILKTRIAEELASLYAEDKPAVEKTRFFQSRLKEAFTAAAQEKPSTVNAQKYQQLVKASLAAETPSI